MAEVAPLVKDRGFEAPTPLIHSLLLGWGVENEAPEGHKTIPSAASSECVSKPFALSGPGPALSSRDTAVAKGAVAPALREPGAGMGMEEDWTLSKETKIFSDGNKFYN